MHARRVFTERLPGYTWFLEERDMNVVPELIRSVLRWALSVVAHEQKQKPNFPGPKLSQFQLGDLMSRSDTATCEAIAREIAVVQKATSTDQSLDALVACIRASWGTPASSNTRRTGAEGTVLVASELVSRLLRFGTSREQYILEVGSICKTWKKTEVYLPGRDGLEVRREFEEIAVRFYNTEAHTVCKTAEFIVHLSKR